jgi:hypothetical protein
MTRHITHTGSHGVQHSLLLVLLRCCVLRYCVLRYCVLRCSALLRCVYQATISTMRRGCKVALPSQDLRAASETRCL